MSRSTFKRKATSTDYVLCLTARVIFSVKVIIDQLLINLTKLKIQKLIIDWKKAVYSIY